MKRLSAQAGVGFQKWRAPTKFQQSKSRKVSDFSSFLTLFGFFGLFDFSGFPAVFGRCGIFDLSGVPARFGLFGLFDFWTFRLYSGALALFGLFVLSHFSTFLALVGHYVFLDFRVRLFVSGSSRWLTFRLFSCLRNVLPVQVCDWALADSIVTRSFLESVIVSIVVVVASSDAPLSKTADLCRWGIDCQKAHVESGLLCGSRSVVAALRPSTPTLSLQRFHQPSTKSLSRAHH